MLPTFLWNISPLSSGSNSNPSMKPAELLNFSSGFMLGLIFTLKLEAMCCSEASDLLQNPENRTVHGNSRQNLKFNKVISSFYVFSSCGFF
jgi:hypothetical protein